jgi:adenylate cyclase
LEDEVVAHHANLVLISDTTKTYHSLFVPEDYQQMEWIVGRSDSIQNNYIKIPQPTVSKIHARIRFEAGIWYIIDLNSSNGTFLNGKKIKPNMDFELVHGSVIGVGMQRIKFELDQSSETITQEDSSALIAKLADSSKSKINLPLIAILAIDLDKYTQLTRSAENKGLLLEHAQNIQHWYSGGSKIAKRYRAHMFKTIGDELMLVWKFPEKLNNEAIALAHIRILQCLQELYLMTQSTFLTNQVGVTAAINTGQAAFVSYGPPGNEVWDYVGNTLNTAFRFVSAGKKGGRGVLLGEDTYMYTRMWVDMQFPTPNPTINPNLTFRSEYADLKGIRDTVAAATADWMDLSAFLTGIGMYPK